MRLYKLFIYSIIKRPSEKKFQTAFCLPAAKCRPNHRAVPAVLVFYRFYSRKAMANISPKPVFRLEYAAICFEFIQAV